jgi:hypothetical protein
MVTLEILSEILTDQCMKLTSLLLGKYDFIDLSHPSHEYWCPFENFAIRFDDVFIKELMELSVLARVSIDVDNTFDSKIIVGTLSEDGKQSNLPFRQACNKIIHAKTCNVELAWSEKHPLYNGRNGYGESDISKFKNPIVKTAGEHNKKEWQSEILFLKYIDVLRERFS